MLGWLAIVLLSPLWAIPVAIGALLFLVWGAAYYKEDRERERRGESICTFVRSLPFRSLDTWILRAVYEELSETGPVRASDHFERDLEMFDDDLDLVCEAIAKRCGRSLQFAEKNPHIGNVKTVADLILFLHHQPRLVTADDTPDHTHTRRAIIGSREVVFGD